MINVPYHGPYVFFLQVLLEITAPLQVRPVQTH